MRIYFPFCGFGYGHLSRSMLLADHLKKRGHEVIFATHEPLYSKVKSMGYKVFRTEQEFSAYSKSKYFSLSRTLFASAFKINLLFPVLIKQIEVIRKIKPDVIISDSYVLSIVASKFIKKSIPYFLMTNQTNPAYFFKDVEYSLVRKAMGVFAKEIIVNSQKTIIPDFQQPHTICIKNISFFGHKNKFIFSGPLVEKYPNDVKAYNFKKKTALVCIGGSQYKTEFFDILARAADKYDIQFIIANSGIEKKKGNIIFKKYIKNYFSYLKGCDFFVSHGGHTSLMEALVFAKPVFGIVLKGFNERENNLIGIKKNKLGLYLDSMNVEKRFIPSFEKMFNPLFKRNAKKYSKLASKDDIKKIIKLIEKNE